MAAGIRGLPRGLAVIAVLVAVVSAAAVLNAQFHDRDDSSAGYVLAGAFLVWWLLSSPGTFWLHGRSGRRAPQRRRGLVLQLVGLAGQGALVSYMIVHYATDRLSDARIDLALAALAAVQGVFGLLQTLGQRLDGVGTAIPVTRSRVTETAFGWAVWVVFTACVRFLGEWSAFALWWVPERVLEQLPTWVPRWLALGGTGLLWLVVVGFATGVLQYRTAQLQRTTVVDQHGPYMSESSHDVEVNPPLSTGLDPVLNLTAQRVLSADGALHGTRTGSSGLWIGSYSGNFRIVVRLFQIQLPPQHVPFWLHFLR